MASRTISALLLALSLLLTPLSFRESHFEASANPEVDEASDLGDPGVVITRAADGSTRIETHPGINERLRNSQFYFPTDSYLLKIDNVYVKDKPIAYLNKLLSGPVGSTLPITFIRGDRAVTTDLNRYAKSALYESLSDFRSLLSMNDLFTGWYGSNRDFYKSGKRHSTNGSNFVAAPYFIAALKRPKFLMPSLYDDYTSALPEAMDFFYRTGMFDRFDEAAKTCLAMSDKLTETSSEADNELLAKCATVLASCNMPEAAMTIYGKLQQSMSRLSAQTQMNVLMGRASLLEKTVSTETLETYKNLAAICNQPSAAQYDNLLHALQNQVTYFIQKKLWKLAETAQLQVIELQRKPSGWIKFSMYQKLIGALLKLSDIYENSGDHTKAQKPLEEALSLYDNQLNLDQQILLERAVSLCPSKIRIKLGYLYIQSNELDKAKHEFDVAQTLVSDALGKNSTQNLKIEKIQALLAAPSASSQQLEWTKALLDTSDSDNVASATKSTNDAQLAREAYDATKTNANKACSIIETLLMRELSNNSLSADNVTRLINLTRSLKTPGSRKKASQLLESLDAYLKRTPDALSTNRIYVKAELALSTDHDAQSAASSKAWENLDLLFEEMRTINLRPNAGSKDRYYSDFESLNNLLHVSYVYAFLDEPAKALSILKHAELRYPEVLNRDISPSIYKALLYVMQGKMSQAQPEINALLTSSSRTQYDYSKMLTALSAALFQSGQSQLSLKLLSIEPTSISNNPKKVLAYRRAILYYELGRFSEALTELAGNDESIFLPGDQMLNLRLLKAELLAKTGQTDKAILAFLKVGGGSNNLEFLPLRRAVSLAQKMPSISAATIEAMIDAAQSFHQPFATSDVEIINYICRIARAQDISAEKVDALERRLSYVDSAQSKTTEITAARSRAQIMESKHNHGASSEWANLARMYFGQGKYDEGTATMLHALQLPSAQSFNHNMYHPGNLRADLGFELLLKAKQYSNAEKILTQCLEMRKSAKYYNGAYIEKSLLCELYLNQDKYSQARKWAEELLGTMSEKDALNSSAGGEMRSFLMFSTIDKFIDKKQFEIAQSLLNDTNKAMLSQLGPRNALFIESYQTKAKLLLAQNNLSAAEDSARQALELENWIGGSANTGRISASLLASILRQEGKNQEADQISVTPEAKPNTREDLVKLYNIKNIYSHMTLPERYADTAEEPLKAMVDEAAARDGEGSKNTRKALNNLTRFYMQQGRTSEAEKIQLHVLEMLNEQYGKCSKPKFGCFLYLAEIYLAEKKPEKALKFAQIITQTPEEDTFDTLRAKLRWANVLLSLGKTPQALELAREVEKHLLEARGLFRPPNFSRSLRDCLSIMERGGAGATADAQALRSRLNQLK